MDGPPGEIPRPPARERPALRALELVVLYVVPPAIYPLFDNMRLLFPALIGGGLVVALVLWFDPTFDRKRLLNFRGARRELPFMLTTFLLGALALIALTLWLSTWPQFEDRIGLFGFVRRNPVFYAIVMTAYPIFSVYPQEIIYRTFFFHRYQCLFRTPLMMILASATAFGWGHVIFDNPRIAWDAELSISLTFVGGLLMAWTYHRSRSTAAAWLEHSLFGDWVWTVGLGLLFYTGAARV